MNGKGKLRTICFLFLLSSFLVETGCGYRSSFQNVQSIAIPIFENKTSYTRKEYDLTQKIHETVLNRSRFRVLPRQEADYELRGTIENFYLPVVVEAGLSQPIISEVSMRVKVEVEDLRTHHVLYSGVLNAGANFATIRGESELSAQTALYEQISIKILNILRDI